MKMRFFPFMRFSFITLFILIVSNAINAPATLGASCQQIFTAGQSGTWRVPNGVTSVIVTMWGGGAGGSNGNSKYAGAGGGGAGTIVNYVLTVTPDTDISYSVATHGVGAVIPFSEGTSGGNTVFGNLTAYGGTPGAIPICPVGGHGGDATDGTTTAHGGQGSIYDCCYWDLYPWCSYPPHTYAQDGQQVNVNSGTLWGGGGGGSPYGCYNNVDGQGAKSYSQTNSAGGYGGGGGASYGIGGNALFSFTQTNPGIDGGGGAGLWAKEGAYPAGNGGDGQIQLTFNANPVTITGANLVNNTIDIVLCGDSSSSGVLNVTANGGSNNYAAITPTNAVGPGTYTVSFDRPNMPIDTYTTITAEWNIGLPPATTTYLLTNNWIVQGLIRHSQYNTPLESACTGGWQFAWVFDSSCNFTKVKLNSNFVSQVPINGTGYSKDNGIIKYCPSSWPGTCATCAAQRPNGATDDNAFLKVSIVTGSCLTQLVPDTSVATYPNPKTNTDPIKFYCSDTALLATSSNFNQAIKTAQDWCKACAGDFRGTQGHIDDYSPSQACSGSLVGDYGNFWTADTKGENQ